MTTRGVGTDNSRLLVSRYPVLFHMAEDSSWPSIRRYGLRSTSSLLDLYGYKGEQRVRIEAEHRPESVVIRRSGLSDAVFGVYLYRDDGIGVFGTNTLIDGVTVPVEPEGVIRFAIEAIELLPGGFDVDIGITDPQDRAYDYHQKGVQFRVIGTSREVGVGRLAHRWEFVR